MDTLQLIDKVHSYYSDSFTQLMYLTISILFIIGVIMPFVLQAIQARSFKNERKSLESLIKGDIQNATIEMRSEFENIFTGEKEKLELLVKEQSESIKQLMAEQSAVSKGGTFFLQAAANYDQKTYSLAAKDFAFSALKYFEGKEEINGQRALKRLINDCLPNLNGADFEAIPDLEKHIDSLVDQLSKMSEYGRFRDNIDEIKKLVAKAKKKKFDEEANISKSEE